MKLRFGDCVLDTDSRRLFREGGEVHLSPKGFTLLSYLVDGRPRALSRLELVLIEDLGSRNGTYVQGRRVDAPMQLAHGDEIRIGPILLTFRISSPSAPTEPDGVPTGDAGSGSQSP